MFCTNCGRELRENQVCDCRSGMQQMGQATANNESKGLDGLIDKINAIDMKTKIIAAVGMAAVMGMFGILMLVLIISSRTIDLSDYVNVNISGYEGYGTASWEFDTVKFEEDYGKKLKYSKKAQESSYMWMDPCDAVYATFYGTLDKDEHLSNGDKVTFTWNEIAKDEVKQIFRQNFKLTDITVKVKDLAKIESFDAFADIHIEYEGCAPYATAYVVNNSKNEYLQRLDYEVEQGTDLANGDAFTVKVSAYGYDDLAAYCAENIGMVPKTDMKQYVAEGLNSYVTSVKQIPEEFLAKMKTQVEDGLRAQAANDWKPYVKLEKVTYIGTYLLNKKFTEDDSFYRQANNQLYVVFNVQVHEFEEEHGVDNRFNYYYMSSFEDVLLLADGTCSADLSEMIKCGNYFERSVPISSGWFSNSTNLRYYGYETLDNLFYKCVTAQVEDYTYEDNVKDIETTKTETPISENTAK